MSAGFGLSDQPQDFDCISFWRIQETLVEFNIPMCYVCAIRSVQIKWNYQASQSSGEHFLFRDR
jgi:hypothetical protein